MDNHTIITEIIHENMQLKQAMLEDSRLIETVITVGEMLIDALGTGRKVLLFGNGGSAADAQHLAAELIGRFSRVRRALAAIALTTDTSALTAISNDYSYESVFARQIEGLGSAGDVAVGISTSGRSPNVLRGIRTAKALGMITVGMTGVMGNELSIAADYCICVPSDKTARIQEAHILIGHILCEMVDERLSARPDRNVGVSFRTVHP